MRPKPSVLVAGYLVLEVILLAWFASAFGTVALISLLLTGFLLGLLVMRIAGLQAFQALTNAQRRAAAFGVTAPDGSQVMVPPAPMQEQVQRATKDLGSSSLLFTAGILLAIPGVISDIAGLMLVLPVVRKRIAARMAARLTSRPRSGATITVVQADEQGWSAQQWTSAHPEGQSQGPRIIRGEVLPPPSEE